jgi:hypothetical protein
MHGCDTACMYAGVAGADAVPWCADVGFGALHMHVVVLGHQPMYTAHHGPDEGRHAQVSELQNEVQAAAVALQSRYGLQPEIGSAVVLARNCCWAASPPQSTPSHSPAMPTTAIRRLQPPHAASHLYASPRFLAESLIGAYCPESDCLCLDQTSHVSTCAACCPMGA